MFTPPMFIAQEPQIPSLQLLLKSNQHQSTHEIEILQPESEAGVHLILDLDEGVQHHGATVIEVHLVLLHPGFVSRLFWVPSEHTGLYHHADSPIPVIGLPKVFEKPPYL